MIPVTDFVEIGKRRAFFAAVDLPDLCSSGRDAAAAFQALGAYWPR